MFLRRSYAKPNLLASTACLILGWMVAANSSAATPQADESIQEIVITAQKRREPLNKVPISATAYSGPQMELLGVRDVADIVRLTPGVTLQGMDDSGDTDLAIRGIISSVGAPTTGIYIDDVPVHVRKDAGVWSDPFPRVFDLDRIEILRGPQGTFFGGSSEGGAVRFITPEASLTQSSGFLRAGLEQTQGGTLGGEIGTAFGTPLIKDVLGVRGSIWHQDGGGYATRISPVDGEVLGRHVNSSSADVVHLNLKYHPTDALTVTPSLFFQKTFQQDGGLYWENAPSDYSISSLIASPHHESMRMGSLGVQYDFSGASLKSITAIVEHKVHYVYNSTQYEFASYAPDLTYLPTDPSYVVATDYVSKQKSYTQEIRLTSHTDSRDTLSWVGGVFYQRMRETYDGHYGGDMNELADYLSDGTQDSAAYFGEAPVDGRYAYVRHYYDIVEEAALYANATYNPTSKIHVSGGVRVSENKFSYNDFQDGPWGPAAPTPRSGKKAEPSVTPRLNVSLDLNTDQIAYVSIAKGYRIGGVNQPVPPNLCQADLNGLGLDTAPDTYKSDSLISYETGFKGKLTPSLRINSSLYYVDWSQIQQSVYLPTCGYGYIANLGKAVSRGFDLQFDWAALKSLTISGSAGYVDAFNAQSLTQAGNLLTRKGDPLATPKWTGTLAVDHKRHLSDGLDGYAHLDVEYAGAYKRVPSPEVYGSDPLLRDAPSVTTLNMRLGVKSKRWDLAAYGRNILDAHTSLYRYRDSTTTTLLALRDGRLTPATFGLSLTAKY